MFDDVGGSGSLLQVPFLDWKELRWWFLDEKVR
jgi:hypothetical protein